MAETLFDELGGLPFLERVHVIFYDKLLSHPWVKDFFKGVPRLVERAKAHKYKGLKAFRT